MLELGVHHLPLVDDGRVVGMITDLDLVGHRRRRSFQLRSEIERAPDVAGVAAAGRRIPDSLLPLIRAGVDPEHLGVITATLVDGLTIRLIELAQEALGPAPAPYAWIALGSAGRRDQGLTSDQDHALVYAGESDEPDDWYQRMAELVVEGLESAGFPRCASKVMASEDGWRGPESWWRARIEQWMMVDDLKAAFLTATAFDGRVAAGDLDVRPLFAAAVNGAAASPPFLRRLERLIAEVKVPVGFLGNLVVSDEGETGTLDIKRGGIHPVNEMARLFALQGGIPSVGTVRRLREAVMAGTVEADAAEGLEEALGLFREVRVKHQAEQWAGGRLPDDLVRPDDLGPLERRALRDAFRLVRDVQRDIGGRLHPRVLGR
jgi:CBS domain-containing protein